MAVRGRAVRVKLSEKNRGFDGEFAEVGTTRLSEESRGREQTQRVECAQK